MSLLNDLSQKATVEIGDELHQFARELFPICRSITGDGVRQTLALIRGKIPLRITEVPTGTPVFDWTVPKEWNIRDAYIKAPDGKRVVDFQKSNLHVLSYSIPVHARMPLRELEPRLFTIPAHPDWVPNRTSYYKEDWGFCLSHNQKLALKDGEYEVCIDSSLDDGHLTYAECYWQGRSSEEVLISTYTCHPSLANDNVSGLTVATFLAKLLSGRDLRYSYRFLFNPATIGAITWLAQNRDAVSRIRHGLVLTCLGDAGGFHYKKSRRGNSEIDRAAAQVLGHCGEPFEILEFSPYGNDERQYCSPGFNLPVGTLMRSVWETFPEYHTSADNLDFIRPAQLAGSLRVCAAILDVLEENRCYRNENPYCEPQLGRRGLFRSMGGEAGGQASGEEMMARLWVLNLSDGNHSLLDIAERSGISFPMIKEAADLLYEKKLLSLIQNNSAGAGEAAQNGNRAGA
jgi:aminopeptidase-like protein